VGAVVISTQPLEMVRKMYDLDKTSAILFKIWKANQQGVEPVSKTVRAVTIRA